MKALVEQGLKLNHPRLADIARPLFIRHKPVKYALYLYNKAELTASTLFALC